MADETLTLTSVARPIGASPNASETPVAAWPSGDSASSTAIVIEPSMPVKALVLGMKRFLSLQVHGHADEVDGERGPQGHDDRADARPLLGPRGADVEEVGDQHLVEHHLR